jgi:hypothetical protein
MKEIKRRSEPGITKIQEPVCQLVQVGVEPLQAALTQGVSEATFEEWMRRGRAGGPGSMCHVQFRTAVLKAEAECEAMLVRQLRAGKQWQAAVTMLERRFPERWLKRSVNGEQSDRPDGRPKAGGDPFDGLDNVLEIRRQAKR